MSTFVVQKEKIVMPRKNSGMWYEVHPTPVKGEDGKNLVYVRPKSGQKLTMKQLNEWTKGDNPKLLMTPRGKEHIYTEV
jgi:hypothetical protein